MPNFPSITSISTANVDAGSDEPRLARGDIKDTIDALNSINTAFTGKELAATGDEQDWTKQQYIALQTLTDQTLIQWNLQSQQVAQVTLGGNRSLNAPTNQRAGGIYTLIIKQDSTGGRSLTFDDIYKFPLGQNPTITLAANAVDIVSFISDGTYLYGSSIRDLK